MRAGCVAVIESASETAHYPLVNRAVFGAVTVPWLTLEYFDESELSALLSEPLEDRFAAVVVTPGAIALPTVRTCLSEHTATLARALSRGVGLSFTATTLSGGARFDLSFLPEGSQVSLVETGMREMAGRAVSDGFGEREITESEGHKARSAVTLAAGRAFGWRHSVELRRPDGTSEPVAWQAQFGLGRVLVSVLPFEVLEWRDVVERSLTRVTRGRGSLIVGSAPAPAWYEDVEPGQFLARLSDPCADEATIDALLRNFSHLRLSRDVTWDKLGCLSRDALLARLENDGTVEFAADGPGDPIYARLQGLPRYLVRLRGTQAQLLAQLQDLPTSSTFHLLALALLSQAAEQVVRGRLYVPDLLRRDTVRSLVEAAIVRRVRDGSVDNLLLPTVNLLVTGYLTGIGGEVLEPMLAWVRANAATGAPDARAQARWSARAADFPVLLRLVPEPGSAPESVLGRISRQLDGEGLDGVHPGEWAPVTAVGGLVSSVPVAGETLGSLDAALVAYSYARWAPDVDPNDVWPVLDTGRPRSSGPHPGGTENIEELCYRTSAQILLDAQAPLTIHPRPADDRPDLVPRGAAELLAQQATAEIDARRAQRAQRQLRDVVRAARTMTGVLAALVIGVTVLVGSVPFWFGPVRSLDLGIRLTLSALLLLVGSVLVILGLATDAVQRIAPRWVQGLGRIVRALRSG